LSWDYVNSDDNLEMAISLNNFYGYPLREHPVEFNEPHIPEDDYVGAINVKKKTTP
jgi:hypothetical protein